MFIVNNYHSVDELIQYTYMILTFSNYFCSINYIFVWFWKCTFSVNKNSYIHTYVTLIKMTTLAKSVLMLTVRTGACFIPNSEKSRHVVREVDLYAILFEILQIAIDVTLCITSLDAQPDLIRRRIYVVYFIIFLSLQ